LTSPLSNCFNIRRAVEKSGLNFSTRPIAAFASSPCPLKHNARAKLIPNELLPGARSNAGFQSAAARLTEGGSGIIHDYVDLVGVQQENTRLRAELAREETQRARLAELEAETLHLSDMLELKQALALKSAAANVIGADASGLARTVVLEGGSGQGFEAGMPVLSTEGVVGKLIAVGPSSSRVLLINDHNSALDAFDQRSRIRA